MRRFDMPSMTPFPLRSLSANEAQACTLIAQRAQQLALHAFGCDWLVDILPVEPWPQALPDAWVLRFEWSGGNFELVVPGPAVADLLATAQLYDPVQSLPDALAALMLEAFFAEVFEALRPLGRGLPQLLEAQRRDALPPPSSHALAVSLGGADGSAVALRLHADAMGLLMLAGLVGRRPPVRQALRPDWPLALRVRIGNCALSGREVATLAAGDVLLMRDSLLDANQQLWLAVTSTHGVLVRLAVPPEELPDAASVPDVATEQASPVSLHLLVVQAWSSLMTGQTETAVAASLADDPLTSLDDLPVPLSFDLGELSLTLAQVRELAPGQVLNLARPLNAAVNVRANGVLVAQGDLVSVDGRLGVSLQQVYLQAAPAGDAA